MKLHKYATLTPDYSPEEFIRLKNSIKDKGGVQEPILVTHDGKLLCGRHRYNAVKEIRELKVSDIPVTKLPKMSDEELREYAIRNEAERRHMTAGQRRSYLVKMYDEHLIEDGEPADGNVSIRDLATKFGEDHSTLSKAVRVKREADPKIWDAVVSGVVADTDAYKILDEDHITQRDCLDAVEFNKASSLSKAKEQIAPSTPTTTSTPGVNDSSTLLPEDGDYGAVVVDSLNSPIKYNDLFQEPMYRILNRDCWVFVRTDSKNLPLMMDMIGDWELDYRFTMTGEKVTKAGRPAGKAGKNGMPAENVEFYVVGSHGRPQFEDDFKLAYRFYSEKGEIPYDLFVILDKVLNPDVDKLILFSDHELSGWQTWQLNEQTQEG